MPNNTFHTEKEIRYTEKLRALQKELPLFCGSFFRNIQNETSVLTRYAYAVDLKGFFHFLMEDTELFPDRDILSLTAEDLNKLQPLHIELYLDKMTQYDHDDRVLTNEKNGIKRKLCSVRSLFRYLAKNEMIEKNAASLVDMPKLHEKEIIRLEPHEVADLLDAVENAEGLTERQKEFNRKTRVRDIAILTLFLGTGIRISELVGIDINDVNFTDNTFVVTRKGGSRDILAFGKEVRDALTDYMTQRNEIVACDGHERAFFLSLQKKRITARAVEQLVQKYARIVTPLKHITPHKLRSTYGTMLYHATQDIYLVADVLGHKDVNTTRKHYAATSEDLKRKAAEILTLREE